ncbi:hypothetical protein DU478_10840 [Thalassococcus profundi]|uniref:DNA primase n=1 Tax=Thalassococcus profundi TaxID=2282382 RepID=A0A369TM99_9RHOB|nr:hypothetical protein [Thalassococcus profundi]RDD66398.1 hypothetical protein DU478_10840 [Thalassococcus profundi]
MSLRALCLSLAFVAAGPVASPVAAQTAEAECDVQRNVVMAVVEARTGGADRTAAIQDVSGSLSGEAEKYATVVPDLAAWIYELPEDQLGSGVGLGWMEACLAQ